MADSPDSSPEPSCGSRRPSFSQEASPLPSGPTSRKRREDLSLPLPPGVLPPRKRAKTAIEKEQRRVERILRNRQAAQSSREKKRKQLEELEDINNQLMSENKLAQERIAHVEEENKALKSKLEGLDAQIQAMKSYMEGLKDFKFDGDIPPTSASDLESSIKRETVVESPIAQSSEDDKPLDIYDAMALDFRIEDEPSKLLPHGAQETESQLDSSKLSSYSPQPSSPISLSYDENLDLLSDLPRHLDARNSVAFETMHHPAAVVPLLDLQCLSKFPQILGPWMARLVMTMIIPLMRVSILCCLKWQRLQHYSLTQSLLTVPVRLPSRSCRKRSLKTTAPYLTRNILMSHSTGTPCLTQLLSLIDRSNKHQQIRQRIHRLRKLLRSRQRSQHPESQQLRSRIGKIMRSTSQLSVSRSSRSRHMALAGSTTAVATGLDWQWDSFRLNSSFHLFSQLLMSRLCDFSLESSSTDLSLNDLRDLRRLSNIVESADICIARNMDRLEGGNTHEHDVNAGFNLSSKYCDSGFGL
ncbi:hypothetical protein V1509DRAFT_628774 [Lipomyces kononenkoae]